MSSSMVPGFIRLSLCGLLVATLPLRFALADDQGASAGDATSQAAPAMAPSSQLGPTFITKPSDSSAPMPSQIPGGINEAALRKAGGILGMTPDQISKLKEQLSSGSIGADEMQQLCVRIASKQISPTEVDGIVHSLDLTLTADQLAQLKSCTQFSTQQSSQTRTSAASLPNQQVSSAKLGERGPSSIERAFQGLDEDRPPQQPAVETLAQYGYDLFNSPVSTFAPVGDVPVGPDYVVGPGDELKVLMWGRINQSIDLLVGRDGTIAIPEIGPLEVAGLTFAQAKKLIEERAGQITGVQVDVTMGRLRTIQVFVIGEVNHPGPYTVSALSHVSNALVACGGITKIGSLRKVELRRGNRLIRVIDLYDILMHGDVAADEQLQPNDVIFVPVIGAVVALAGDVKRPAIYELRSSPADLSSVIKLAGGISAFGYSQRIQVERVENHKRRAILDTNLDQITSGQFEINDGDLIKVYPVLPLQNEIVTAEGNVNRPGKYEWHEGMRVADLIKDAEGLAPRTFTQYALISREQGPSKVVHFVPVDLDSALSDHLAGPADISLRSQDVLKIFSLDQIRDLPTVQALGELRNPGFYMLNPGMRVSDLVYLAGGLKDDAYLAKAEVARTEVVDGTRTRHTYMDIDLRASLTRSDGEDPRLRANDELFVWRAAGWHLPWVVRVGGEVLRPGPYTIHEGDRFATLLIRCGGLLRDAYPAGTVFIRRSVKQLEEKSLDESRARLRQQIAELSMMPTSSGESEASHNSATLNYLRQVLEASETEQASGRMVVHLRPLEQLARSSDNLLLEDQDEITIPKRPSSINVLGQVYHPTAIVYEPPLTMRDYLDRAGGPNDQADTEHVFVVKADGSILTDDGIRNASEARMFPLLPVVSGGLMTMRAEPGDTIYVPEKLLYSGDLRYATDIAQIVASAVQSVAIVGLIATNL